jgi:DNA-binding MarR family transcriptional regulator
VARRSPLPPAAHDVHDVRDGRDGNVVHDGNAAIDAHDAPRAADVHGTGDLHHDLPGEAAACDLDRLIHERLRLGIVSALAVNERLSFGDLKGLLHTTDGNLSVHARKLEEAGYVRCDKSFVGRLPKTEFHLTPAGRRALERYLDHMEAIIHATRAAHVT